MHSCKISGKIIIFYRKKYAKCLVVRKIVVPLHPLNEGRPLRGYEKEFFERLT